MLVVRCVLVVRFGIEGQCNVTLGEGGVTSWASRLHDVGWVALLLDVLAGDRVVVGRGEAQKRATPGLTGLWFSLRALYYLNLRIPLGLPTWDVKVSRLHASIARRYNLTNKPFLINIKQSGRRRHNVTPSHRARVRTPPRRHHNTPI